MSDNTGSAKVAEKKDKAPSEPSFNMDELQQLAELVNEHGFTDFEFENENIRVRLSKQTSSPAAGQPVQYAQIPQPVGVTPTPKAQGQAAGPTAPEESDADLFKITSPIVGT